MINNFKMPYIHKIKLIMRSKFMSSTDREGVATNSGLGGSRFKSGPFLYCKYERAIKESNLHRFNSTEHNIKQNIYTGMEVISLMPP